MYFIVTKLPQNMCANFRSPISNTKLTKNAQVSKQQNALKRNLK